MLVVNPIFEGKDIKDETSSYNPNQKTRDTLAMIRRYCEVGEEIMTKPYEEFGRVNAQSGLLDMVGRQDANNRKFNNYIAPASTDPDLSWHADTIRPLTRNKVISIVAHVTANVLFPNIVAQNDNDEEDEEMAVVMRDAVEWACEQSKYEDTFIEAVQDMCVNPAIILYQDFADVKRKIKTSKKKDGSWNYKKIVDEIYSGFISAIVPNEELYISNIYEPNIQKQTFLIRRQIIEYDIAKQKYGDHKDFKYIEAGLRVFYMDSTNTFYRQYDNSQQDRLVEKLTIYIKGLDLELVVINGVMVSDPEDAMRRDDKNYPFAKSGYETYNSRFFYYMALVQKIEPDQNVINTLYNYVIDGAYLNLAPPINVYGVEDVDGSNFAPREINVFDDPDTKVESMKMGSDVGTGLVALNKVESSASESSQDPRGAGLQTPGEQTKYEVQRLESNAQTILGRTGKMVAGLVRDYGNLVVGSIVQNMPVAEVGETTDGEVRLTFPRLFLENREVNGKQKSRKIEFTTDMPTSDTQEGLDEKVREESFKNKALEQKLGMSIMKVRPESFRRMKYLVKVSPEFISNSSMFARRMALYDRGISNPIINQETLVKETMLKELVPGKEDKFINKKQEPVTQELNKSKQPSVTDTEASIT